MTPTVSIQDERLVYTFRGIHLQGLTIEAHISSNMREWTPIARLSQSAESWTLLSSEVSANINLDSNIHQIDLPTEDSQTFLKLVLGLQ